MVTWLRAHPIGNCGMNRLVHSFFLWRAPRHEHTINRMGWYDMDSREMFIPSQLGWPRFPVAPSTNFHKTCHPRSWKYSNLKSVYFHPNFRKMLLFTRPWGATTVWGGVSRLELDLMSRSSWKQHGNTWPSDLLGLWLFFACRGALGSCRHILSWWLGCPITFDSTRI